MDPIIIAVAFMLGFIVKQFSLPPLIGYLCAGFALNAFGVELSEDLKTFAELGITLLLFTIGLKLPLKTLKKPEVYGVTVLHISAMIIASTAIISLCAFFSVPYLDNLTLENAAVLAFALSFSSTVVVFKVLEENAELKTRHGQIAIGVLVLQDLAAILFLAVTAGKVPSIWASILLLLPLARPLLGKILTFSGHGEMLTLTGIAFAVCGGFLFESLGIKADLGALLFGMLLSSHSKASELSKTLMSFKDIFLIGFFVSIGFSATPTLGMLTTSILISGAILLKFVLFFLLFTAFKVRGRTAYLSSLSLANFSEFGLIVISYSIANKLLPEEMLVIMALSLTFSFIVATILNKKAHKIYVYLKQYICAIERKDILKEDIFKQPKGAKILIVGMGRVGAGAYEEACKYAPKGHVWGVDSNDEKIRRHKKNGLHVITGDAENYDFWQNMNHEKIELVMLTMPTLDSELEVLEKLKASNYKGKITVITKYDDHTEKLIEAGADIAFNVYAEAGIGFAEETFRFLNKAKNS